MKIEYYHASKYGNGAKVAEEFKRQMAAKGITINVHHVKDVRPKEIPLADLYVFSAAGWSVPYLAMLKSTGTELAFVRR